MSGDVWFGLVFTVYLLVGWKSKVECVAALLQFRFVLKYGYKDARCLGLLCGRINLQELFTATVYYAANTATAGAAGAAACFFIFFAGIASKVVHYLSQCDVCMICMHFL